MISRRLSILILSIFVSVTLFPATGTAQHGRRHRGFQYQKYQRIMRHAVGHHGRFEVFELDSRRFAMVEEDGQRRIALLTVDYSDAEGYIGITNSLLLLDPGGTLLEVRVVDSEDTPPYLRRLIRKGFLNQFAGLKPGTTPEVDAVTGATMTCDAITQSVTDTLKAFGEIAACVDFSGPTPIVHGCDCTLKKIE